MVGCSTVSQQVYLGAALPADQVSHIKNGSASAGAYNGRLLAVDGKLGPCGRGFGYASSLTGNYDIDILPGDHTLTVGKPGKGLSEMCFHIETRASHTYVISVVYSRQLGFGWKLIYDQTEQQGKQSSRYIGDDVWEPKRGFEGQFVHRKWETVNCAEYRKKAKMTHEQAIEVIRTSLELTGRWLEKTKDTKGSTFVLEQVDRSGFAFRLEMPLQRDGITVKHVVRETVNFSNVTNLRLTGSTTVFFDEVSLWTDKESLFELPFFTHEPGQLLPIRDEKNKDSLISALVVLCEKLP